MSKWTDLVDIMQNKEENTSGSSRRTILIVDDDYYQKMHKEGNRNKAIGFGTGGLIGMAIAANAPKQKSYGIPRYRISLAEKLFTFSPGHPIINNAYSMYDLIPDQYIIVASYHNYYRERKFQCFYELCGSLGAREVTLEYAEENNMQLNLNADADVQGLPISGNMKANFEAVHKKTLKEKMSVTFSKKNSRIVEYNSPWIATEPDFEKMINNRKKDNAVECWTEVNITDDLGINASLSGKIQNLGFNIGGEFKEFKEIKYKYHVLFWEL
jgi:hypothetical protein